MANRKKFTQKQLKLLTEIYRRLQLLSHREYEINQQTLVLPEIPSNANCLREFEIIFCQNEVSKQTNWYRLTEKGLKFFSNYYPDEDFTEEDNILYYTGEKIKEFDINLLN